MIFWRSEATYAPITAALIELAEMQLQCKLPARYIELLQEQNGGYIVPTAFATTERNSWADDHVNIDEIFGIAPNEGLLLTPYYIQEWGLPERLVLFAGGGHEWFAFDYRGNREEPAITYIEPDSDIDFVVAPNFDVFLAGLHVYE